MMYLKRMAITAVFCLFGLSALPGFAQSLEHPLRPPQTGSPQATLQSFVNAMNEVHAIANQDDARGRDTVLPLRRAAATIDMSSFPVEIRRSQSIEVALLLDEVLDRVGLPDTSTVPSAASEAPNKWRIPNTPIAISLVEGGPRAGEYLFTAQTALNIREYYEAVRDLPYSDATSPGLYTAYLTTPGPGIALRWSERLPEWSKKTLFDQTYWQWIALAGVATLLVAQFIPILRASRSVGAAETEQQERAKRRNQFATLLLALALTVAAAWFVDEIVNLTGDTQITVAYVLAILRFFLIGWIVIVAGNVFVDAVSWARGLEPNSAGVLLLTVASWIVVGLFLFALVVAAAQRFGLPAYSVVTGLGVGGIAIGLGAQALVRDILSGVFFLMDDAFRKGEYVRVGDAMGNVEKISIRSMQLRHHLGAVHTIPYGQISQLTNFSRDWVIVKLSFTVPYETDPKVIKRIFKEIGGDMMADPAYADSFIEPFKSQGVFEFDDVGMVVRGKFMTKPGEQFTIRAELQARVKAAFDEAGINFARKEVRVAMPEVEGAGDQSSTEQRAAVAAASATDPPKS
ncbi:mechanosensitive ion channel family protein [Ruegeria atlantica]|uniref:mechanosensitive ion channel family protein n=1 Tax=Ruegeria atlantica TaxID=81569 RepID=UPI00147AB0AD|nr:mechanosensitive ion channel family protein [Ruegeria atlantica]